ncbi:MAG: acyl-CoA desaturase, partial [Chitinophagaceae bacterium]|nr:acyl-CoA desaturase [Chitinophagaceae bacterium]
PHSPHFIKDVWGLMMKTKTIYLDYRKYKLEPEAQFIDRYPTWKFVDRFGDLWVTRLCFVAFYIGFYVVFATHWYLWLLLPFHFMMGPLHGAIVNWCGHKYGYSNHDNDDHSKNSLPLDFLMMGELFQNNHHKKPNDVNFAQKWYEFDPSYPIIKIMHKLHIIRLRKA